jgi:TPP-dependent indolepyruvate ferredoxin oxidoreductase alpha subunit
LLAFLSAHQSVCVQELGSPFLLDALRALCQAHGLPTRIEAEPPATGEILPIELALPAPDALEPVPDQAWAAEFAARRPRMPRFAAGDPRALLFQALRALERPTLIATDPGVTGVLGIGDGWVDTKLQMGGAAPLAAALARATRIEGEPGAPLAVAVMGDTNYYHSELPGVIDNAIAGRDVLHVLVVNRKSEMTAGVRTPYLDDQALIAQLRVCGLHTVSAPLADTAQTARALQELSARSGPRALVLLGEGLPGQVQDA